MSAATPEQPRLLDGRYLLAEQLGRGGMADVYRARDQVLNRDVAVKVFRTVPGEADRKRYETEVSTLASLRHPGLVLLFDAGTDDAGRPYAVMQLLEGASLADRDEDVRVPVPRVAEIGAALADALAFVHAHGVVHRDVKPANVLLDDDGRPLLADFGIARSLDATGVTGTGLTVGTAAYMAPEQVRGEPVDGSADVYALGLMLLELLTGYREYEGSAIEAALARLTRPPRLPDFIPPVWQSLLSHMTALEPADRPTATQVAEWLRGDSALRGDGAWVPPARGSLDSGSRQAGVSRPVSALSSSILRSRADGVADATTGGFAGGGAFAAGATGTGPRTWRGEETYGGRTGSGAGFAAPPSPPPPVYDDEDDGHRRGGGLRLALVVGGIAAVAAVIFGVAAAAGLGGSGNGGSPDAVVPGQTVSPATSSSGTPSGAASSGLPSDLPTTPGGTTPSAGSTPTSGTTPSAGTAPTQGGGGGVDPQPTRRRPTRPPVDPTTPPVTTPPVTTPVTTPPVVTPTVVPPTTVPTAKPTKK